MNVASLYLEACTGNMVFLLKWNAGWLQFLHKKKHIENTINLLYLS